MSRCRCVLPLFALLCASAHAASLVSTDTLTDPQALADADADSGSWLGVFDCLRADSPAACLQSRAVRAFEHLLPDDEDADVEPEAGDKSAQLEAEEAVGGVRLPKGMSPAVGRIIDRIGDMIASGISQWIPEETDVESAKSANDIEDQARGHHKKKKVHKAVKKLMIKLLILLYVKQQAIKLFLYSVQTFVFFKLMVFFGIWVATQVVKAWTLLSWHHHQKLHDQKVLYIEPQIKHVSEHHGGHFVEPPFEHVHHEEYDHHGYEYEPSPDTGSLWPRSDHAQRIAYKGQIPANFRKPAATQ